ncbi:nucleoside-diphosphate-sugar epimerase [Chitinophaga skermanii]|uniref:Nucleoside-diphosphate-sugar epimerase n=1 Tax=Chitinophaga skermanii TaxID=331697 RepID=A0A327Q4R8_9BACT|nr:NAD-dependent epimerase/dehydratase family protein [Chitinophaga skermanii]RAI99380.1 nucleoside-diphosphate-sugar epimerase [Chitinophaga skermanii]
MQTILGANGVIGYELAKALKDYTNDIRLVSRAPKPVNESDQLFSADLLNYEQTCDAVRGSEIVYLTIGLPYKSSVWEAQWPVIMQNVINACIKSSAKLVFFDNVYAYGKVKGEMTENTPMRPVSRKGVVRKRLTEMLIHEIERNTIPVIIARSADFYGPRNTNSVANLIFDNLVKGKTPQWLGSTEFVHSFTYTPDAGQATAILGNTPSAYNQTWHLPTDAQQLTMQAFISTACEVLAKEPKTSIIAPWMMTLGGLFNSTIRESKEMMYQYDAPYFFDSSKFQQAFNFVPTSYQKGIVNTIQYLKNKKS